MRPSQPWSLMPTSFSQSPKAISHIAVRSSAGRSLHCFGPVVLIGRSSCRRRRLLEKMQRGHAATSEREQSCEHGVWPSSGSIATNIHRSARGSLEGRSRNYECPPYTWVDDLSGVCEWANEPEAGKCKNLFTWKPYLVTLLLPSLLCLYPIMATGTDKSWREDVPGLE